jgi:hypothetical protein
LGEIDKYSLLIAEEISRVHQLKQIALKSGKNNLKEIVFLNHRVKLRLISPNHRLKKKKKTKPSVVWYSVRKL